MTTVCTPPWKIRTGYHDNDYGPVSVSAYTQQYHKKLTKTLQHWLYSIQYPYLGAKKLGSKNSASCKFQRFHQNDDRRHCQSESEMWAMWMSNAEMCIFRSCWRTLLVPLCSYFDNFASCPKQIAMCVEQNQYLRRKSLLAKISHTVTNNYPDCQRVLVCKTQTKFLPFVRHLWWTRKWAENGAKVPKSKRKNGPSDDF